MMSHGWDSCFEDFDMINAKAEIYANFKKKIKWLASLSGYKKNVIANCLSGLTVVDIFWHFHAIK